MKLTIYAKTQQSLNECVACFIASYKATNFLENQDTWPMGRHIPWREGFYEPSPYDLSGYSYFTYIEI